MNVVSPNTDIAQQVEEVLTRKQAEKEQAELKQQLEASLDEAQSTIEELTALVTSKDAELVSVKAEIEKGSKEIKDQIELYKVRIQQLEKEVSDVSAVKATVEEQINSLKSIARMDSRIKIISDKGISRKGEAFDSQKIKIASLSDEEFTAYVDEMVALKTEFATVSVVPTEIMLTKEEIEKFAKVLGCDAGDEKCDSLIKKVAKEVQSYNKVRESSAGSDGIIDTPVQVPPPPKLDPKSQVIASLNLETQPSESLIETYEKLGKAMASKAKRNQAVK